MLNAKETKKVFLKIHKALFSKQEQIDFLEYMGCLLDAGIAPLSALVAIQKSHQGKKYKTIVTDLLQGMREGKKITDSIVDWFPPEAIAMIEGYDRAGKISQGFLDAAKTLAATAHKRSDFYAALIYPLFISIAALCLMIFLNRLLIKGFLFDLSKGADLEMSRNILIYNTISDFIENNWWKIILGFFIFIISSKIFLRNFTGKIRKYIDFFPLFSFYAEARSVYFLKRLELFLRHNVNLQRSLKLMLNKNTRHLKYYINCMLNKILTGNHKISRILDVGLIHKDYIYYLEVMEIAQHLEKSIEKLIVLIEIRHAKILKRFSQMLRTLLFIFSATVLMFSYLIMFEAKNVLSTYQNSPPKVPPKISH